jgi:hypothetical protein
VYSAIESLREVRAHCFILLTDSRNIFLVAGSAGNLGWSSHFTGSSVFPVGTWYESLLGYGPVYPLLPTTNCFFLSRIDLVISTLSLNYLRVIFCNPCSADKFHENNSSLQNYNSFRFCVAFLSNAKLQLLQYWTVSLNNRIVVFHHEFFWLFGQGSMINRNSQFPVNADTVLVSASCLR